MKTSSVKTSLAVFAAALLALGLLSGPAGAADFFLEAGATTKTMPDGRVVPIWGYKVSGSAGDYTSPGPELTVPAGDTILNITLTNTLPVESSIYIPSLHLNSADAGTVVRFPVGHAYEGRAYSFAPVAAAAGGTYTYSFTNVPAGTVLYQSGTDVATQVEMGLFGAVTKDHLAAAGLAPAEAYPGVAYDQSTTLVYGSIDPDFHDAVAAAPALGMATVHYHPQYWTINGVAFDPTAPAASGSTHSLAAGNRVLLRMANAGNWTDIPTLLGGTVSVVARDGKPYANPQTRYTVQLTAGGTRDALFTPTAAGDHALYSSRMNLTNGAGATPGGALWFLHIVP